MRALLVLAWPLMAGTACAQAISVRLDQATRVRMDQAIRRCLEEDGTPSASVAVVVGGEVSYMGAYGDAALHPKAPALTTTRYQLASISKTFTAEALLLLEADGKLSLTDKVSRWFPDVTGASEISLRELLNHTSGLPDHNAQGYPAGAKSKPTPPDQIIAEWGHHPLLFPPGTQFHYSNLEYQIAGRIAEKVSGTPLFQLMQERIFTPLRMTATIDLDTIPQGSAELATGYVQTALAGLEPAPYEGPGWSFGSGQVVTTAHDVALWDIAFLKGQVLPPQQAAEETTVASLANGTTKPSALGLFVSRDEGVLRYYHTGEAFGFEAVNIIYPNADLAIVVLTNTNVEPTYLKIADELTYLLLPPTEEGAFARNLFAGLQNGRPDLSLFSDDLKQYLTSARLNEYSSSLGALGPPQAFSLDHSQTVDGLTTRDYEVTVAGRRLHMHLLLLPDQKLEDIAVTRAQ